MLHQIASSLSASLFSVISFAWIDSLIYIITPPPLSHYARLNKECLLDIAMWHRFLTEWNVVALFLYQDVIKAVDFTLYTDVSTTVGYGGFFRNRWFQGRWPPELMLKNNEQLSMAFLELYPIVVSAILWGLEWKGKKILFYCDNEAIVHIKQG